LIKELNNHFPWFALFNAMGILYPQYWLQLNLEESFANQLDTLKTWYCEPKVVNSTDNVPKMPFYD
jgi:hypothetical protein